MSVKLFNKKTGQTANCERENWTTCRDHMHAKGWIIYTPAAELTAARKEYIALIDGVIDNSFEESVSVSSYNESIDDVYESPNDDMRAFSEDSYNTIDDMVQYPVEEDSRQYSEEYNVRAEALRDKITRNIREMGIGSNFDVQSPVGPQFSDEYMTAWNDAGRPPTFEFTGDKKYAGEDVWHGNCISCGAKVINHGSEGWEHPVVKKGKTEYVTYCPVESKS